MKLQAIASALGCRLDGDPELEITGIAGLSEATAGELSFLSNPRYAAAARRTGAAALIAHRRLRGCEASFLLSDNPYLEFARALDLFHAPVRYESGIHPTASIAPTASLGRGASVGPFVVIEDRVTIGANAVLRPHVVIEQGCTIGEDFVAHAGATVCRDSVVGNRVVLHHRVTIGSDGFGFARRQDGTHRKIAQTGHVVLEDDIEIQAGTCVDRAAVGETRIGRGTIMDNLVQIGHAVQIGPRSILCAQVGIAGSTKLGADCVLAGQAGVINHLNLGDRVLVTAQSGVGKDVPDGSKVSGSPAFDNRKWLRSTSAFHRLPEIEREVRRLRKVVSKLGGGG